jgi:type IV pilus assembly protein PilM
MLGNLFKKDLVGITFSSKGVVIVEQGGGKSKNYLSLPYPSFDTEPSGISSDDIFEVFKDKEMELLAFLQKAIRDSRLDTKDVVVALPPKDLIIRFFEMPNIPRSEVAAGINFEMKKYIPFKIEELAYDFQYRIKQKVGIIEVILCGMRQAPLEKYVNLFNQLDLNPIAFEPALFSLFRLLVIKNKLSSQSSYLVLEFDKQEANILITEKNFPYFTRDIKLTSNLEASKSQEDFDAALFRLINEVRVSLDYYKRQFMKKDVDEMIIISNKNSSAWIDHFSKELGLKVTFIDFEDLLKVENVDKDMLSDFSKALGAALRIERPSLVTLNLAKEKEKGLKTSLAMRVAAGQNLEQLVLNFLKDSKPALIKGGVIGLLTIVLGYGIGFSKLFPLQKDFAAATVQQPPLLSGLDVSSLESAQASETILMDKQRVLKGLIDGYRPLYRKLGILPKLFPAGVWLNTFSYDLEAGQLLLSCSSYDKEEKVRSENMNKFIENLKKDADFIKDFSFVELKSYRETAKEYVPYLEFDVTCSKTKQE